MDKIKFLFRSIYKRSLFNTLRYIYHELAFDLKHGTETKPENSAYKTSKSNTDNFIAPCQGASPWVVGECFDKLRQYGLQVEKATFLDIGSGKGRVMLLAGIAGFKQVLGVELDSQFCKIARQNMEINLTKLLCKSYEIFNDDVTVYQFPEDLDVAFMFNPFGRNLIRLMLNRLISVRNKNNKSNLIRPLYIIYVNPVCADVFDEMGLTPVDYSSSEALIYKIEF